MAQNVSIATKPLVYEVFRYINNKVWNALAEYVDNSIQSYIDHKEILQKINPNNGNLRVSIDIDFDKDCIIIEDNAFGITKENYERAFELANIPLDNKGLNEFGMGMKVSSIWLSNNWKVETTAFNDDIKKTLIFNLQEVVDEEKLELPVLEEKCDPKLHYTKITLSNLSQNKPTSRQLTFIKKHIESIYTEYLREGILDLYINDEKLEYHELKILKAPHYSNPNGTPILWKKDIDFSFLNGKYSVKGFIALLDKMSTSTDNGFLLFRRGRVIGTSYEDRYRPKLLCGQEGSPQFKRVFGEFHLEGFDVSFTKNSFQEDDDFNLFIELLKEEISKKQDFDIFNQGQNYRPPKTEKEIKKIGEDLAKQIAKGFNKPIHITPTQQHTIEDNSTVSISDTNKEEEENTPTIKPSNSTETSNQSKIQPKEEDTPVITTKVDLGNGSTYSLSIVLSKDDKGLYTLLMTDESGHDFKTIISMKNPFFEQFSKSLSTSEGKELLAYIIKILVASELAIRENGGDPSYAFNFRTTFNNLFGII